MDHYVNTHVHLEDGEWDVLLCVIVIILNHLVVILKPGDVDVNQVILVNVVKKFVLVVILGKCVHKLVNIVKSVISRLDSVYAHWDIMEKHAAVYVHAVNMGLVVPNFARVKTMQFVQLILGTVIVCLDLLDLTVQ